MKKITKAIGIIGIGILAGRYIPHALAGGQTQAHTSPSTQGQRYNAFRLANALVEVESGGDCSARGDGGRALGCLQIHMICVRDVNRIAGTAYTSSSRRNLVDSIKMCRIYLAHWCAHYERRTGKVATAEIAARIWNGGPAGWQKIATLKYWNKVKKQLEKEYK